MAIWHRQCRWIYVTVTLHAGALDPHFSIGDRNRVTSIGVGGRRRSAWACVRAAAYLCVLPTADVDVTERPADGRWGLE